jgi:hypothetical protein
MQSRWFAAVFVLVVAVSEPAIACALRSPIVLDYVRHAQVVVVGQISDYQKVRGYARFEIQVDEVLLGSAPSRLAVTWHNSTFATPEQMAPGPFLIALRQSSSTSPPVRGPSTTVIPNAEPNLYTVLQATCSSPFLFESKSNEASIVRGIVTAQQP